MLAYYIGHSVDLWLSHRAKKLAGWFPLMSFNSKGTAEGDEQEMAIETLGAALRQINRLFASGAVTGFSDAQLLERFVCGHDAAAFEALVGRHGPMVLSVCRGILGDPNDAEDAFQATFLILVKKAGTFRGHVALAGWLYLVAHRVAIRANAAAARRRAHERQAGQMAAATRAPGRRPGTSCCGHFTRRSPGCRRNSGWRSSSATCKAFPRTRPPGNCD